MLRIRRIQLGEPPLHRRERHLALRDDARRRRCDRTLRRRCDARLPGDGRLLQHLRQREPQPRARGLRHDLDAQQRVAAQLEEVVRHADSLDAQHARPDLGQRALGRATAARRARAIAPHDRAADPAAHDGPPSRCSTAAAPPARRTRRAPCAPAASRAGTHAASTRQASLPRRPDTRPVAARRPRPCARPRRSRAPMHAASSAVSISPSSIRKPRIFTWKSSRPRYSTVAVGEPARQVARAIHPGVRSFLDRRERIVHEPLRRQLAAGCDSRSPTCTPARYSSPGTPIGTSCAAPVEHVEPRVRDRPPDRHHRRRRRARRARPLAHVHRALRRPVQVVQLAPRAPCGSTPPRDPAAAPPRSPSPRAATRSAASPTCPRARRRRHAASRARSDSTVTPCALDHVGEIRRIRDARPGAPCTSFAPVSSGQKNSHTD